MKFKCLILLLCSTFSLSAQIHYSYISDCVFNRPDDLLGYRFIPAQQQNEGSQRKQNLDAEDIVFHITPGRLTVTQDGEDENYNVNIIKTTKYGYKLLLMNAVDPTVQGHLKIVLNDQKQADAIIFKIARKAKETVYFQGKIEEEQWAEENGYFTHIQGQKVMNDSMLWSTNFRPFFEVGNNKKQRLYIEDSTYIRFVEQRISKDKKKENPNIETIVLTEEDIPTLEADTPVEPVPEFLETEKKPKKKKKKRGKKKAKKKKGKKKRKKKEKVMRYIEVQFNIETPEGDTERKTEKFPVKKWKEFVNQQRDASDIRYQIQISVDNLQGGKIHLYLTEDRAINSIEIGGILFKSRGQ